MTAPEKSAYEDLCISITDPIYDLNAIELELIGVDITMDGKSMMNEIKSLRDVLVNLRDTKSETITSAQKTVIENFIQYFTDFFNEDDPRPITVNIDNSIYTNVEKPDEILNTKQQVQIIYLHNFITHFINAWDRIKNDFAGAQYIQYRYGS